MNKTGRIEQTVVRKWKETFEICYLTYHNPKPRVEPLEKEDTYF